jgi:hypothetical protein
MRKTGIAILLLCVMAMVFLIVTPVSPTPRPKVRIALQGYTNEASGRFAIFVITNQSAFSVIRHVGYTLEAPAGEYQWTNCYEGWFLGQKNLKPLEYEVLIIPIPTNQPAWRLSLNTLQNVSLPTLMMRKTRTTLRNVVGLGAGQNRTYSNPHYSTKSDWIGEPRNSLP